MNYIWHCGATRIVLLIGRYALKAPRPTTWRTFLNGLLANMQEREFSRTGWPELCPVLWSLPGGWLIVMPRCEPMCDDDWCNFNVNIFVKNTEYTIPVELKKDSFGFLNGRVVAIDYGS